MWHTRLLGWKIHPALKNERAMQLDLFPQYTFRPIGLLIWTPGSVLIEAIDVGMDRQTLQAFPCSLAKAPFPLADLHEYGTPMHCGMTVELGSPNFMGPIFELEDIDPLSARALLGAGMPLKMTTAWLGTMITIRVSGWVEAVALFGDLPARQNFASPLN